MKLFIVALTLFVGISASAANVAVTSFSFINGKRPLAELCGQVSGMTSPGPAFISIVVDPRGKPGTYNTFAGASGKFCITLISYTGEAELSFEGAAVPAVVGGIR